MQQIFWNIYLLLSFIAMVIVAIHTFTNKLYPLIAKIAAFFLLFSIGWWGYYQYTFYEKQVPFSKIESKENIKLLPPIPLGKEAVIEKYLKNIDKNRPIVIALPIDVQIRFTDPVNPSSPHAIFRVLFVNEGSSKAIDMYAEWNIIDNGRKITSPAEWSETVDGQKQKAFILLPQQNFVYIYGPEIGAYAVSKDPKIELTLKINYKDEEGKEYGYSCKSRLKDAAYSGKMYLFDILDIQ